MSFLLVVVPSLLLAFVLPPILFGLLPGSDGPQHKSSRYRGIDGLRGYLAIGVLCHHFYINWMFSLTGQWVEPDRVIYRNLGPVAVSLFFMITAFLFYGKIIERKLAPAFTLYRDRLLRLGPMYFVTLISMVLIVISESGGLSVPIGDLIETLLPWVPFTLWGSPDINGYLNTGVIVSGVFWTLRYEWVFYLLLPVLAALVNLLAQPAKIRLCALAILFLVILIIPDMAKINLHSKLILPFISGMIAAEVRESVVITKFASSALGNILSIVCVLVAICALPLDRYSGIQCIPLLVAFTLIALGSNIFNVLEWRGSRLLGDATYSVYLLHGIFLYLLFQGIKALDLLRYSSTWLLLPVVTMAISIVSLATYKLIELPFMSRAREPKLIFKDVAH